MVALLAEGAGDHENGGFVPTSGFDFIRGLGGFPSDGA
jgi:hypothetical protein